MTISELEKGQVFKTKKGNSEYMYVGKIGNEAGECFYLTTRLRGNGKSGFWTSKDIEI